MTWEIMYTLPQKREVTSINNDSTAQRTIVVPKDNLIIAPKETGK